MPDLLRKLVNLLVDLLRKLAHLLVDLLRKLAHLLVDLLRKLVHLLPQFVNSLIDSLTLLVHLLPQPVNSRDNHPRQRHAYADNSIQLWRNRHATPHILPIRSILIIDLRLCIQGILPNLYSFMQQLSHYSFCTLTSYSSTRAA